MEKQNNFNVKNYLDRFDEILFEMATKMLSSNIINNITIDFIQCMIPHHRAAIYMCENLLQYTNYTPLQTIANGIIKMQTRGIQQMKEIALYSSNCINSNRDVQLYMQKYLEITKETIYKMNNSPRCENINLNFVNEMIPHHEGAISMCQNLLQYPIEKNLIIVANTIITEQSRGVMQLKEIRNTLCSK